MTARMLAEMDWPTTLRVAVLAPHPDDFDAIGVTMRQLYENGNSITVAVLTTGAGGVEDEYAPTTEAKRDTREAEQRASCRFFGLQAERLTFLRMAEDATGHLIPNAANRALLQAWCDAQQPDVVFMPHGNDTNADHRRAYALFQEIKRAPLLACLNRDPKTIACRADLATGFGEAMATWKAKLLRFHASQQQRNLRIRGYGFDERILRMNRQVATELGGPWPYAECFELEHF